MPRTVALFGALMLLVPLGCATAFRPGLANAPQLNGSPIVDGRVHDAIANGGDSCERRLGPGPLRNEVPACVAVTPASDPVALDGAPANAAMPPWVKPYFDRGSCPSWDNRMGRLTVAQGFTFVSTAAETTCTTPL
jgi:hypothetical protein